MNQTILKDPKRPKMTSKDLKKNPLQMWTLKTRKLKKNGNPNKFLIHGSVLFGQNFS